MVNALQKLCQQVPALAVSVGRFDIRRAFNGSDHAAVEKVDGGFLHARPSGRLKGHRGHAQIP